MFFSFLKGQPMNSEGHAFRSGRAALAHRFGTERCRRCIRSCHYVLTCQTPPSVFVKFVNTYAYGCRYRRHAKSPVRRTWSTDPRTHRRGRSMYIHIWTRLTDLKLEARTVYGVATRRTHRCLIVPCIRVRPGHLVQIDPLENSNDE